MNRIILGDCMEGMKRTPDKYYDLACVDPPYGIDIITNGSFGNPQKKDGTITHGIDKRNGRKIIRNKSNYATKDWDKTPPKQEYFNELMRVSKNQIIFGANHFISKIPFDSSCWIVWDKVNGTSRQADCELAWTSFKTAVRLIPFKWYGRLQGSRSNGRIMEGNISKHEKRIHPTQKPTALYDWIFKNYAEPGMKVLDTHGGSLSSVISAIRAGLMIDCYEIDKDYYEAGKKRVTDYFSQLNAFESQPQIEWINDTSQIRE